MGRNTVREEKVREKERERKKERKRERERKKERESNQVFDKASCDQKVDSAMYKKMG